MVLAKAGSEYHDEQKNTKLLAAFANTSTLCATYYRRDHLNCNEIDKMTRLSLLTIFLGLQLTLLSTTLRAQKEYISSTKMSSFNVPASYQTQKSNHVRNEFVFVSRADTTSLVINVNTNKMTTDNIVAFKKASNSEIEKVYFVSIQKPKIVKRGEVSSYPQQSAYFHVTHGVGNDVENDYMMTYLFYHKGQEINFIFRSKARRLPGVLPQIEEIINSVKLL